MESNHGNCSFSSVNALPRRSEANWTGGSMCVPAACSNISISTVLPLLEPRLGWGRRALATWLACKPWACGLVAGAEEGARDWSSSSSLWMVPAPFLPAVTWEQRLLLPVFSGVWECHEPGLRC